MNSRLRDKLLDDKELCDLVMTDKQVADLLGIKIKTLYNIVSGGRLADMYSISPVNGKRFWYRPKVLGLC